MDTPEIHVIIDPSRIVSVKLKFLFIVMMQQHLSDKFINECIDEAERLMETPKEILAGDEKAKRLAARF